MTNSTKLLNAIKDKMIEFANENGIILAQHFATVEDFKQFVIAFTFKVLTDMGVETSKAFDLVAGDGQYDQLVKSVYEIAKSKA